MLYNRVIDKLLVFSKSVDVKYEPIWKTYQDELFEDLGFCESKQFEYCLMIHEDFKKLVKTYPMHIKNQFLEFQEQFIENLEVTRKFKTRDSVCQVLDAIYVSFLKKFMSHNRDFLEKQLFMAIRQKGGTLSPAMAGFFYYNNIIENDYEKLCSPAVDILETKEDLKKLVVWYETKGMLESYDYNIMVFYNYKLTPYRYRTKYLFGTRCPYPFGDSYEWDKDTQIFSAQYHEKTYKVNMEP